MIWTSIKSLLSFPILFFWKKHKECKETNKVGEMIMWFIISLSGVALFGLLLLYLVWYLLTKRLTLVIVVSIILWLYAIVRDKYFPDQQNAAPVKDLQILQEQAEKGYPIMRNIIYQILKDTAPDIGGTIPRLLTEIEMPEGHYILKNGVCFYQFLLPKENIRVQYKQNDLDEFKRILQNSISLKIQSRAFPAIQMENYRDRYGNWLDSVILDTIEDVGNVFILQTVFTTAEYAEYLHQKQLNSQIGNGSTPGDFTTSWGDSK